jgi:hypothetical protein
VISFGKLLLLDISRLANQSRADQESCMVGGYIVAS